MRTLWGSATDQGLVRSINEDSLLAYPPVFLVADGMGGHDAGNVASRVVVDDGQLTPQLQDAIRLVLDGRSHELDDDLLAQLTDYFADTEPNQTALPAAKPKKHRRQPERGSQPTD